MARAIIEIEDDGPDIKMKTEYVPPLPGAVAELTKAQRVALKLSNAIYSIAGETPDNPNRNA